jgi:hypothetical protein
VRTYDQFRADHDQDYREWRRFNTHLRVTRIIQPVLWAALALAVVTLLVVVLQVQAERRSAWQPTVTTAAPVCDRDPARINSKPDAHRRYTPQPASSYATEDC